MNDYVQCTIPADMLPFMATALYELVVRMIGPESDPVGPGRGSKAGCGLVD